MAWTSLGERCFVWALGWWFLSLFTGQHLPLLISSDSTAGNENAASLCLRTHLINAPSPHKLTPRAPGLTTQDDRHTYVYVTHLRHCRVSSLGYTQFPGQPPGGILVTIFHPLFRLQYLPGVPHSQDTGPLPPDLQAPVVSSHQRLTLRPVSWNETTLREDISSLQHS